jgi:GNAT superfamily N-acetyltransferase
VTDDGTESRFGRRAGCRRSDAVSYASADRLQHRSDATRAWLSSISLATPARPRRTSSNRDRQPYEVAPASVEYLVRSARITDIERLVALSAGLLKSSGTVGALVPGDLLRQLVYLPQASIFVAEARRDVVGGAVLALRPSVRAGGYVGTVDLLVVDPDHEVNRVTDALLEELIRSARNKGCSVIEAALPDDPATRTRWEHHGFIESGPHMERPVAVVGTTTSPTR